MELQILLAGVEFGPYTVDQTRELLGEGFLSETDPAKRLDETDWLPLGEVLAQISETTGASEEAETEPAGLPAPAPHEEEEPVAELPPEFESFTSITPTPPEYDEPVFPESAEDAEASMPEPEPAPFPPASTIFPEASEDLPPAPIEAVSEKREEPSSALARPAAESKAIEIKTPRFSAPEPSPIVSETPLIQVSLPAKAKKAMRTGSLLAQDALRAARNRTGILSPSGAPPLGAAAPAPSSVTPPKPSVETPLSDETPAPRRKQQLVLRGPKEEEPVPVAPPAPLRKAIRLTGRITLPGLAPKPDLSQGQPTSLSGSGPLFIGRPSRTGASPERKTTRALTAKERTSFLLAEAKPSAEISRKESAETEAKEKEIAEIPTPSPEKEPESTHALVQAAGEEMVAEEPAETTSAPDSISALLQVAGTETVAQPPEASASETSRLPTGETATEPDLTASGSLTSSGDLSERRSLKITGPLRHPTPHLPVRLGSPSKPGESSRLPYSTGERPTTALPPLEPPLPPASEESLRPHPETGKIPVSAMPNEGVRIRARRITTKVPVPEKERRTEPAPSRPATPPPLPQSPTPVSPSAKKNALMSIPPPTAETAQVVPPPAESKQSASVTDVPLASPMVLNPGPVAETSALPAQPMVSDEVSTGPVEKIGPAEAAKPNTVRLRRPVKLELSSKAKIQESGRLTLEAFSKMASLDLPGQVATVTTARTPAAEISAPAAKESLPVTEPIAPSDPVTAAAAEDYSPPLPEAPPLAWKSAQPKTRQWEWMAYVIITLGAVAVCLIVYKFAHRTPTVGTAAPVPIATADTNPSGTETTIPPASAAPPAVSSAPSTDTSPSTAPVPAPAPSTAAIPAAAAPRSPPPEMPPSSSNTAPVAPTPNATVQDLDKQVEAFVGDGMLKYQNADFTGAMAAYNQALNLNPKAASALYNRGIAKAAQNDLDGAVADYSEALQNDPGMAAAYYYRGLARHSKAELDEAVSDYNQAIQLDPKNALAYYDRGLIRMQKDDIDGAIFDSTRALALDPHLVQSYYDRGLGRLAKGAMDAALSDMKTFCQIAPQDSYTDYARLYIWLIESQQGHLADASQELSKAMNLGWNGAAGSMVTRIGEYLLGQIPEAELIKSSASSIPVKDQGQRCEAWYFIGMRHLQAGDKQRAIEDLRKCVGTQKTDYCEFILAQETLKSLNPAGTAEGTLPAPRAQAVTLPDPGTMGTAPAEESAPETPQAPAAK